MNNQISSEGLMIAMFAVVVYGVFYSMAKISARTRVIQENLTSLASKRYGALDALRGMLAIGVMVHHTFTSCTYKLTGVWDWGSNAVLNQLGQSTVAIFFMITGMLFAVQAEYTINWRKFYKARICRLMPLHTLVVATLLILVFVETNWQLRVSPLRLSGQALKWLTLTIFGRPDINEVQQTWTRIAGVNWSLPFEVAFYVAIFPCLNWLAKSISLVSRLIGALVVIVLMLMLLGQTNTAEVTKMQLAAIHFTFGIITGYLYLRYGRSKQIGKTVAAISALIATCFICMFDSGARVIPCILAFGLLCSIVFGRWERSLLYQKASIWLGDISYGIYLIHGLVLWVTINGILNAGFVDRLGPGLPFVVAAIAYPIIFVASSASYILLEKPVMEWFRQR